MSIATLTEKKCKSSYLLIRNISEVFNLFVYSKQYTSNSILSVSILAINGKMARYNKRRIMKRSLKLEFIFENE